MRMKNRLLWIIVMFFLLTGCFGSRTPSPAVKQYALEYEPPRMESKILTDDLIRVERFTGAQDHVGREMVYRSQPFAREDYRYHRWYAAPVDMVQALLSRDLRQAGFFRAVLPYEDPRPVRYLVEGQVEEFLEIEEKDRSAALLVVGITLVETGQQMAADKIIFQKTYRVSEPLGASRQPGALARGMSAAMGRLSHEWMGDLRAILTAQKK